MKSSYVEHLTGVKKLKIESKSLLKCTKRDKQTKSDQSSLPAILHDLLPETSVSKTRWDQTLRMETLEATAIDAEAQTTSKVVTQILADQIVATKAEEEVTNSQVARQQTLGKILASTEAALIETRMVWDTDSNSKPQRRRAQSNLRLHQWRLPLLAIVLITTKEAIMETILMVLVVVALITTITVAQEAVPTEVLAIKEEHKGKLQARKETSRCSKTQLATRLTMLALPKHTFSKCRVLLSKAMLAILQLQLQEQQEQQLRQLITQLTMLNTMASKQALLVMVNSSSTMRLNSMVSTLQLKDKVPKISRHTVTITISSTTTTTMDSNSSLKDSMQQVSKQQSLKLTTNKQTGKRRKSETVICIEGANPVRFC